MAGKRVKCPKCNEPLTIPAAKTPSPAATPRAGITDLLDEVGVRGARLGPVCPDCGEDVQPGAILCIQCGYNFAMGRRMYTEAGDSQYQDAHGESNVEKLLAKAERELDETPISAEGEDFGDGPESFLIAGAAAIVAVILAAIGVTTIVVLDLVEQNIIAYISITIAILIFFASLIWITITAFLEHVGEGIACVSGSIFCTIGLILLLNALAYGGYTVWGLGMMYPLIYAAKRGMWIPLFLFGFSLLFTIILYFAWPSDEEYAMAAIRFFC